MFVTDSKLGILEKTGDGDVRDLAREVRESRQLLRWLYTELSINANYVEKNAIKKHAVKNQWDIES